MGDILRSAQQLHRLVENVLAISNGPDEPLQANIDVVELNSITSRVAGINLIRADRRKIQLTQSYGADRIDVAGDHWMVAHMLEELDLQCAQVHRTGRAGRYRSDATNRWRR